MTPKVFRILLLINVGLSILSLVITYAFPELIPEAIRIAEEKAFDESVDGATIVAAIFGVALIIASAIAFIGLYTFKPWSRRVNLILTAAALLFLPMIGYQVTSGWALFFEHAGLILWGALLTVAYLPPMNDRFVLPTANASVNTDATHASRRFP